MADIPYKIGAIGFRINLRTGTWDIPVDVTTMTVRVLSPDGETFEIVANRLDDRIAQIVTNGTEFTKPGVYRLELIGTSGGNVYPSQTALLTVEGIAKR